MSRPMFVSGYPVMYYTTQCEWVCGDHAEPGDHQTPYWEGSPFECEHEDGCSNEIHSAYGEVES